MNAATSVAAFAFAPFARRAASLGIDMQRRKLVVTMRMNRLLTGLPLLLFATSVFAQDATPGGEEAAGAAAGLLGASCGCIILILSIVIQLAIAFWVYKDAKARGMDNAVLLTVLTVFTGLIGLLVYLLMRPKGSTAPCSSCGKKRMEGTARCPHCGNP